MIDVVMPQMGVSVSEGTISQWLKAEGETFEKDETLLEISTDKVDAEIPSPAAGWSRPPPGSARSIAPTVTSRPAPPPGRRGGRVRSWPTAWQL